MKLTIFFSNEKKGDESAGFQLRIRGGRKELLEVLDKARETILKLGDPK